MLDVFASLDAFVRRLIDGAVSAKIVIRSSREPPAPTKRLSGGGHAGRRGARSHDVHLEACRRATVPSDPHAVQWSTCVADVLHRRGLPIPPESQRMTVAMQPVEADALLEAMLVSSGRYVEWGSGGSTELIAWLALSRLLPRGFLKAYSTESSSDWMRLMLANRSRVVARACDQGLLEYRRGDIGRTLALGFPLDFDKLSAASRRRMHRQYVSLRSFNVATFDTVLIDGRFRVACAIEALRFLAANSTVLWHDAAPPMVPTRYWLYRRGWAPFYDVVGYHGSLVRLRPKAWALGMSAAEHEGRLMAALQHAER